jgi:hypothetical protein
MKNRRTVEEDLFGSGYQQPINQKVKGNKNELVVAKILTRWTGTEFVRVPRSGGLRWQNVMNICGDVLSTDPSFDFPFVIETKDLTNLHITSKLRKNSFVYTAWEQVTRDSVRSSRFPVLLLRKTGETPREQYTIFLEYNANMIALLGWCHVPIISEGRDIIGMNSLTFFKNISYDRFIKAYQQNKRISSPGKSRK